LSPEGGFYAALDADSEGVEGKYYCWSMEEIQELIDPEDLPWIKSLYSIKEEGNWENGSNILFQTKPYEQVAEEHGLELTGFFEKLSHLKARLLEKREKRVRPGLDDKCLCGWNAWAISGLVQAYRAIQDPLALELAEQAAGFIKEKMTVEGILYRSFKAGSSYTPAFLEDYAAVIQAYIELYQATFEYAWLEEAKRLLGVVNERFWDEGEGLYFYNDPGAEKLIADKKEIFDNVIPSSNALMAKNLHNLGLYFYEDDWVGRAQKMLDLVKKLVLQEPGFMSQWANVLLFQLISTAEVAVVGEKAKEKSEELLKNYHPNILIAAGREGELSPPLLAGKKAADSAGTIYVCYNKSCRRPVNTSGEAISQLPSWD
jgi:uncharacterized protein